MKKVKKIDNFWKYFNIKTAKKSHNNVEGSCGNKQNRYFALRMIVKISYYWLITLSSQLQIFLSTRETLF